MSSRNFRNLNRAYNRGHITPVEDQQGRVTLYRRTKSVLGGAPVKDMHLHYAGGAFRKTPWLVPINFVLA
jgi:hypothetical protein